MDYGFVGPFELLFLFLIVILVVGPLRIWRGVKVIRAWLGNFVQRLRNSKVAKQGRGVLRGLGKMIEYYNRDKQM